MFKTFLESLADYFGQIQKDPGTCRGSENLKSSFEKAYWTLSIERYLRAQMELDNKQTCFEYFHVMGELLSSFLTGSEKLRHAFRDGKKIHDRYYQDSI